MILQSLVETRYGASIEMRTLTSISGPTSGLKQADENYCFFGNVPVLRRMDATQAPNFPPEQWNPFGESLWWWVPAADLNRPTIVIFDVPMERISAQPRIFASTETPDRFFFSKIWFGSDGYATAFSAKDTTVGLDIDPDDWIFQNLTTVDGLDYYRSVMGEASPETVSGDVDSDLDLDLADAVRALQILCSRAQSPITLSADVNNDEVIGLEEAIYILRRLANVGDSN